MWKTSPSIVHPVNEAFVIKQFGIDFVIMRKKQENSKSIKTSSGNSIAPDLVEEATPRVLKQQENSARSRGYRQSDIYLKPFESGICIEENLTTNHRLLFNKYPARKQHLLVITKEPES